MYWGECTCFGESVVLCNYLAAQHALPPFPILKTQPTREICIHVCMYEGRTVWHIIWENPEIFEFKPKFRVYYHREKI